MREIKFIVIHCSATRVTQDYTVEMLRRDHVNRNGWRDIGYHYYITKDGEVHHCRPEDQVGAHVKGFNEKSIGVCYEGGVSGERQTASGERRLVYTDTRTAEQVVALHLLLSDLKHRYPEARIVGHRDLLRYRTKVCPCFDAAHEYEYIV